MKWKNTTSYSQGEEKSKVEPRTWRIELEDISISISRHIHYEKDQWVMYCRALNIEQALLDSKEVNSARDEAIHIALEKAKKLYDVMHTIKANVENG